MNYIVFDLEWNQCPQGKYREKKEMPFEIVEIGAIKLNSEQQEIGRFHEIIKPSVYRTFHFKTQEILKMNMDDFKNARTFPDVFKSFYTWCGEDPCFCIWGSSDLVELQRNMHYHRIENSLPYPLKYYDIQKIFSIVYEDRKSRRNLEYAVDFLGITKELDFHHALSDAYYTSLVMKQLTTEQIFDNYSFDYYHHPVNRKEEIYAVFHTYSKFVSKEFHSKNDAMKDRKVAATRCYLCNEPAHKKIRWFSNGTKNYYCLAYCQTHGYLKGKIRMKKSEGENFYCIKTLKLVDTEEAQTIKDRQEQLRRKKRQKRQAQACGMSS